MTYYVHIIRRVWWYRLILFWRPQVDTFFSTERNLKRIPFGFDRSRLIGSFVRDDVGASLIKYTDDQWMRA